jgi:hypothetical protein
LLTGIGEVFVLLARGKLDGLDVFILVRFRVCLLVLAFFGVVFLLLLLFDFEEA